MPKSETQKDLERIFKGDKTVKIKDNRCAEHIFINLSCPFPKRSEQCVIVYENNNDFKEASALTIQGLEHELVERGVLGIGLIERINQYKQILRKLQIEGYTIREYDFLGSHLLRIVT